MDNIDFWHRQQPGKPLFSDMHWSRPENRLHAGKLLIVGGNLHGFNAPAEAYAEAEKAGIGTSRILLPDALSRTLSKLLPEAEFVPSTPSGSFATKSLSELIAAAAWADGVLLAGGFGKNSETAILLESFLQKHQGPVTLAGDSVDYFLHEPMLLVERPATTVVLDTGQAQKLLAGAGSTRALTTALDLVHVVDILHEFTAIHPIQLVLAHEAVAIVAVKGEISTTANIKTDAAILSAPVAVWWLQNPTKPFEALTTALV